MKKTLQAKAFLILALISFGSALSMDRAPDPRPQSQQPHSCVPQIRDGFTGGIQVGNPSGQMMSQGTCDFGATSGSVSGSAGISGNSWGGRNFNIRGSFWR